MIELSKGDIELFGRPLHDSPAELIQLYDSNFKKFMQNESVSSCGSYFIHDPFKNRIITSPGYVGGYISNRFAGTMLKPILREMNPDSIKFHGALARYLNHSFTDFWPYQSVFRSIYRLPPGCVISYENSVSYRPYIHQQKGGFREGIEEALESLRHLNSTPTIMYSGGVDSTALCVALRNLDVDFEAVSIDIGPNANSAERAMRVGEKFDINIEPLEFGWPPQDQVIVESIIEQMENDFVNPFNPHHVFAKRNDGIVISGQNIDSVLTGDMHRPQINLIKHVRATRQVQSIPKYIIPNLQYTSKYQNSNILQQIISNLISVYFHSTTLSSSGGNEYLLGQLTTGIPNVIDKSSIDTAYESLSGLIFQDYDLSYQADVINHHQYQHNANKHIGSQSVNGTRVYLPAMWGPLLSRFIGRSRSATEAFRPKPHVYRYVECETGLDYEKVAYESLDSYRETRKMAEQYQSSFDTGLLADLHRFLQYDKLQELLPPQCEQLLDDKFEMLHKAKSQNSISRSVYAEFFKLLNLSKLIKDL